MDRLMVPKESEPADAVIVGEALHTIIVRLDDAMTRPLRALRGTAHALRDRAARGDDPGRFEQLATISALCDDLLVEARDFLECLCVMPGGEAVISAEARGPAR